MTENKTSTKTKNDKILDELEVASETINVAPTPTSTSAPTPISKPRTKITPVTASTPDKTTDYDMFKAYVKKGGLAIKKTDGSLYLKSEAWLFLAHIKGLTPSVDVVPVYSADDNTRVLRVTAVCKLYDKDGIEVSQSTMVADHNEPFLKDLDNYAVFGLAETRAISRAVRNVYGYIAKAVGFESTPAAEMGLEGAVQE